MEVIITFNRLYQFDLLTIYVPWTMLIIIGWSSFWIDSKGPNNAVRFMIVLACLLYASHSASVLNERFPKVMYTKMVDVWTGVNTVMLVILEFLISLKNLYIDWVTNH